jgi:hypothetical protein
VFSSGGMSRSAVWNIMACAVAKTPRVSSRRLLRRPEHATPHPPLHHNIDHHLSQLDHHNYNHNDNSNQKINSETIQYPVYGNKSLSTRVLLMMMMMMMMMMMVTLMMVFIPHSYTNCPTWESVPLILRCLTLPQGGETCGNRSTSLTG